MHTDPLELLKRNDKWYLGSGEGVIWAPPAPLFLDRLGFWDSGFYFDYEIGPMFTVSILDEEGKVVEYRREKREWSPARLLQTYDGPLQLEEKKAVIGNTFLSEVRLLSEASMAGSVIVWTCVSLDDNIHLESAEAADDGLRWRLTYTNAGRYKASEPFLLSFHLKGSAAPISYSIQIAEEPNSSPLSNQPDFNFTPFYEQMACGYLNRCINTDGLSLPLHKRKLLFIGLQYRLEELNKSEPFAVMLAVGDNSVSPVSVNEGEAKWRQFFSEVPQFYCSDPWIEKYYWYRWYGLKLNMLAKTQGNYQYPCIAEGPNPVNFRHHITYSAWCHILETRWMQDTVVAKGSLRNFIVAQRDDGSFVGGLGTHVKRPYQFNANWGFALRALQEVHPDDGFVSEIYPALAAHARFFMEHRDSDSTGLYEVTNQIETGQEYSPRYLAASGEADHWTDFRLKGVDVTVYVYELLKFLAEAAGVLGNQEERTLWLSEAERTREAVRKHMWDEADGMFYDLLPGSLEPIRVKTAVCFYPFMTDLADESHRRAISDHLLNPDEFWTPYPVPTLSVDHPMFDPEARWKGQRHDCPWNGRVWPMTNSHLVEALANSGEPAAAAELLHRFIKMMYFDSDLRRPNCFEHYNPFSGKECLYRQVDDYQHSWVVDLVIKYVAGLRVKGKAIVVDPLPMGLSQFSLVGARVQGRMVDVVWSEDEGMIVRVDGVIRAKQSQLGLVEIELTGGSLLR